MCVGIVESRQNPAVRQIDAPRFSAGQRQNFLVGAYSKNPPIANRDRGGSRIPGLYRVHQSVVQDHIRIRTRKTQQRQRCKGLDQVATSAAHMCLPVCITTAYAAWFYKYAVKICEKSRNHTNRLLDVCSLVYSARKPARHCRHQALSHEPARMRQPVALGRSDKFRGIPCRTQPSAPSASRLPLY
jgi:hypothetical protein